MDYREMAAIRISRFHQRKVAYHSMKAEIAPLFVAQKTKGGTGETDECYNQEEFRQEMVY